MAKHGEDMNEERENGRSKADFIRLAERAFPGRRPAA